MDSNHSRLADIANQLCTEGLNHDRPVKVLSKGTKLYRGGHLGDPTLGLFAFLDKENARLYAADPQRPSVIHTYVVDQDIRLPHVSDLKKVACAPPNHEATQLLASYFNKIDDVCEFEATEALCTDGFEGYSLRELVKALGREGWYFDDDEFLRARRGGTAGNEYFHAEVMIADWESRVSFMSTESCTSNETSSISPEADTSQDSANTTQWWKIITMSGIFVLVLIIVGRMFLKSMRKRIA